MNICIAVKTVITSEYENVPSGSFLLPASIKRKLDNTDDWVMCYLIGNGRNCWIHQSHFDENYIKKAPYESW